MKLPGRLSAAIEVLQDIATRHRPVSSALRDWGVSHRFAGSGDRAAIGNLVYDALRRKASHSFVMGADTPRALVMAVAVRDWGLVPAELNAQLEGDKFAPDALTDAEIEQLASADLSTAPAHVQADVPEWTADALEKAFGADWIAQCRAMTDRPALDVRANGLKASQEKTLKALDRFKPEPCAIAPHGVRIAAPYAGGRTPNVQTDETYLKGGFEIQDQGSQIVARLVAAKSGDQLLDYCAGAGGKTLALAADMANGGQIFAHDSDRSRLAPIYDRLKRAGVRNAQVLPPKSEKLEGLMGRLDKVVIDAPCTGTGTWRRRPDAKWRLSADQLDQRCAEQTEILDAAAPFVRPGGELVYITCSVLPQENGDQAEAFLKRNADFTQLDMTARWVQVFPSAPTPNYVSVSGIMLSPGSTHTDGFFVSIFQRNT